MHDYDYDYDSMHKQPTYTSDMIQVSKEWTNDYEACLSGDDNDLKTITSLILQSQESQQVKVRVNLIIKGQRSRKVNPRPSQWSRVEILNLIIKVGYLSINPNPIGKLKSDLLNMSVYSGHNFCYTTRIDAIQLGLETRLKNLQFICFTLFNWRSLRGSKLGRKVRVVICQL